MESGVCFFENEQSEDRGQDVQHEFVRRVQAGDQAAFRELVEQHQTKIYSVIHRILRNREDSEDVAQQVFTKVYFAIKNFDGRCSLLTWIYKIAVNECYSHLRRQRARTARDVDAPEHDVSAAEGWSGASREPAADITMAARDFLNKLLARVPEEERLLLVMKEVEGHSIGELAAMTGSTESAIKTKLFRARQKLIEVAGRLSQRTVLAVACH